MGKGGGSTPTPQPANTPSVINQQTAQNVNTALNNQRMNNVNQITPYGDLTYTNTGGEYDYNGNWIPQYTATTRLSPEQQRILDSQTKIGQGALDLGQSYVDRIRANTAQPFSYDGISANPTAPQYDADFRKATYEKMLQRANPQQEADRRALAQRLADQGIGLEDPAYATAMRQFDTGLNDFRLGADLDSLGQATQDFSNAGRAYELSANQRDREIQERLNLRNQPINEIAALMGLSGGVKDPTFVNTPQTQVAPTDVAGIYANSGQEAAASRAASQRDAAQGQAGSSAAMAGLFGLGSAAIIAV